MDASDDRWAAADGVFERALAAPPERRSAVVAEACGGDDELRALVERLLRHAASGDQTPLRPGGALDGPIARRLADELGPQDRRLAEGTMVGAYQIVGEIGRGGMSAVYLAERAGAEFTQRVAVKVIQSGIDGTEAAERFALERQILADARHPDIARLIDGGVTEDGRHFLVMELVNGVPIDEHCAQRRLPVEDRLRLILRIARAVASAHRSLVVHRDIKPSNVLVTPDGDVKLLDFGIAKLLDPASSPRLTRTGAVPMTPAYAAPEQVRGEPVTTATDVYQLGVLAYVVLTGVSPHGDHGGDSLAIARAVVERLPSRLWDALRRSGEVADRAESYRTTPARLRRLLGGDLEAVVMRALEKRPPDRYGSMDAFASDLAAVLDGRAVTARPFTATYRLRLFARRNVGAVAAAAVLLVALVGWTVTTAVQGRRVAAEAARANREAMTARRVSDFMTRLFAEADPDRARGGDVPIREVLERGRDQLSTELVDEPVVRAQLLHTLAAVFHKLGVLGEAEPLYREALALRETHLGPDEQPTLQSLNALAALESDLGRYDEARGSFERSAESSRRTLGEDHPDTLGTLNNLAVLEQRMGNEALAAERFEELLEARRRALGPEHRDTLQAMVNLGLARMGTGQLEEARQLISEARAIGRRTLGEDHPFVLAAMTNEASALLDLGRLDEAGTLLEEALVAADEVLGPDHPMTLVTLASIGDLQAMRGQHVEAAATLARAADGAARAIGPDHPTVLEYRRQVGDEYFRGGLLEDARRSYHDVLAAQRRVLGDGSVEVHQTLYNLACVESAAGNIDKSLGHLEEAVRLGYSPPELLADPDLAPLHGKPRFERIAAAIRPPPSPVS